MQTRKFDEMISYFNRKVSSMDIDRKYKIELLGMITAIGLAHEKEMPHWVLCSERLPEPRMAVLGCAPRYENIYALYYDSVMGWMVWNPIRDDCFPDSQGEIIAWMPLPEPWRGKGD